MVNGAACLNDSSGRKPAVAGEDVLRPLSSKPGRCLFYGVCPRRSDYPLRIYLPSGRNVRLREILAFEQEFGPVDRAHA